MFSSGRCKWLAKGMSRSRGKGWKFVQFWVTMTRFATVCFSDRVRAFFRFAFQEPVEPVDGDTPSTTAQHSCAVSSEGSPRQTLEMPDMPELPPFPAAVGPPPGLGAPPIWPPPALSLAEALGISEIKHEENGRNDSLDSGDVDAFVFKLTLRVADDMDLGLCFTKKDEKGEVLRIDKIESGAAESWNRQCSTSGSPERVLSPGDLVVSVNDQSDPEMMLQECKTRKLLKLRVLRRESKPKCNDAAKPWEAEHVQHVQYPLTFPTGLGYGRLLLNC